MEKRSFNFNSLLLALLLGVGGWSNLELVTLGKQFASFVAEQRQINLMREEQMRRIESRLMFIESQRMIK